ncbi:MAG: sulfur carrier protein ThiS adenylyltransferase ThiF [Phascolarctobacterium sp.]|nr:sulfur carrier protein ThiS adenylyltransferase ThiF [Phascolarctobacterium sp.]
MISKDFSQEEWNRQLRERCDEEATRKLQQARVAVAGLGGLGSNIAILLVRMGVENLHLIDFDKVDFSNLHRQQYFPEQIGEYKTEALASILKKINPYVKLKLDCVKVTEENLPTLFTKEDIICEAFDNPQAKAMLVNGVLENFPGKVMVASSGMAGLGDGNLVKARRLNKNLYLCGDGVSDCAMESLYAARVALCGAQQAHLVQRIILGLEG